MTTASHAFSAPGSGESDSYKWVVLSNTTLGVLMATIDSSITLIALPDIFRGIDLDPLLPANGFYLFWMILSFLVVSSVLVASLGRLGDLFGRVRMYNLGFLIYTVASLLLTVTWMSGREAALYLVIMRVFQGVGAAFLVGTSPAILTDAFPPHQRGLALGLNSVAGISGSFVGLVLGGVLAPINWRLIFLISVPIGMFGTWWAYRRLEERRAPERARIDWAGNLTFAAGLVLLMIGVTYGIQPYGDHTMGWSSPAVVGELAAGAALLVAFLFIEARAEAPMFRLPLLRIRAFSAGVLATFLAAVGRGGLMFILVIWLQGIWLPLHGYSFERTPLWAGIYMLPLTIGFLVAGPLSGILSDRHGPRPFALGGMLGTAAGFGLLLMLPIDFPYPLFAMVLLLIGMAMGAFGSPNRASVMNSLPAADRGAGGGMMATFQNSAQVLSIGVFFTLMIAGLAASLPASLSRGLAAQGVPAADAHRVAELPPISTLFAAFLGENPMRHLLGPEVIDGLPAHGAATVTGRDFFPRIISGPFTTGLHAAFAFAIAASLVAAAATWMRGRSTVDSDP
ncbi:MAG: MFS transporter [Thermoleophilia bacterium]